MLNLFQMNDLQMCGVAASTIILAIADKPVRKKRKWVKAWLQRQQRASHNQIFQELRSEESNDISHYTRMPYEIYFMLLQKISPVITKQDTQLRTSIPAGARFAATLR